MEREISTPPAARHLAEQLPGSPAHEETIAEQLTVALERNKPIGRAGALAITEYLLHRYGENGTRDLSGMLAFAESGFTTFGRIRYACLELAADPHVTAEDKELVAWLAESAIDSQNIYVTGLPKRPPGAPKLTNLHWCTVLRSDEDTYDAWVPASATDEELRALGARLRPQLDAHGGALRAFLSLADVDASSDDLAESFQESFVGSYPLDREHVLEQTTEYVECLNEVGRIAEKYAWGDAVTLDVDAIWDVVAENLYDIVELGQQYHVFQK